MNLCPPPLKTLLPGIFCHSNGKLTNIEHLKCTNKKHFIKGQDLDTHTANGHMKRQITPYYHYTFVQTQTALSVTLI